MPNRLPLLDCSKEFFQLEASLDLRATVFEAGGQTPIDIISADQDWFVKVEWEVSGKLPPHLYGKWFVHMTLESLGPGAEYEFPDPPASLPMESDGDGKYEYRIEVGGGQIFTPEPHGALYIISVILGSSDENNQYSPLYVYCTGEELHFVNPP